MLNFIEFGLNQWQVVIICLIRNCMCIVVFLALQGVVASAFNFSLITGLKL